jgi:hypothetical protein
MAGAATDRLVFEFTEDEQRSYCRVVGAREMRKTGSAS